MKPKSLLWSFIIILFTVMLVSSSVLILTKGDSASPATVIYVDPPISAKDVTAIDQEFTVSIRIAQVQFLYGWRFDLEWNSSLLEIPDDPETFGIVEGVSEGPFLNKEGEFQTTWIPRLFADDGRVSVTCALQSVAVDDAPSGSGTLATVTFKVKVEGECPLHFSFTWLARPTSDVDPTLIPISHSAEDGYFKYPLPILYVEPSSIMDAGLGLGSNLTINIKVSQITDLYAWNLTLYWNPAILEAKNVTEGPFLKSAGTTVFSPPEINQTGGYLNANCSLVDLVPGANGTGTIANITFQVKAKGQSRISLTLTRPPLPDLDESVLVDGKKSPILHATANSIFSNLLRDIAVTKITVSSPTVKVGDSITVNATVKNEGFKNETSIAVSVTTPSPPSPSYVPIGTTTIPSLEPGQETTLSFTWNTENIDKGEYTIRAEASTVPEEIDIEDNILDMEGTVEVTSDAVTEIPTTLIIGAVIAIAVVALAVFLYIRRRS
jgi:hypothetical protein